MKIEWDGGELFHEYEGIAPFRSLKVSISEEQIWWPELVALEDSVLGLLLRLSQRLTKRFPWWDAGYMPGFVLMKRARQ